MALDESQEDDEIFDKDGLTFLIDRPLFAIAKPIRVDFTVTHQGGEFAISSAILENTCALAKDIHSCQSSCSI
jgi:Fe-S cluster assembly iron-binding protein IscA